MTDLRKAAEMALEALNIQTPLDKREFELRNSAIQALRQALAQPEQEPVGWRWLYNGQPDSEKHFSMPGPDAEVISRASACEFPRTVQYLYTAPPKREWVGLTDVDKVNLCGMIFGGRFLECIDAVEAKLKEKNT